MPQQSPVVFIAAHGSVIDKYNVVTVSHNCNVVCLTKVGVSLPLSSYNLALSMLLRPGNNTLHDQLTLIESIPSTVSVRRQNSPQKEEYVPERSNINNSNARRELIEFIEQKTQAATNSSRSWELLEHTLRPVEDILSHPEAISPEIDPEIDTWFSSFIKRAMNFTCISSHPQASPPVLSIYCSKNLAKSSSKNPQKTVTYTGSDASGKEISIKVIQCKISNDQLIYVTPGAMSLQDDTTNSHSLLLSEVIKNLSKAHLFALKGSSHCDETESRYEMVYWLHENMIGSRVLQMNTMSSKGQIYDFAMPDDINVVLGACRGFADDVAA